MAGDAGDGSAGPGVAVNACLACRVADLQMHPVVALMTGIAAERAHNVRLCERHAESLSPMVRAVEAQMERETLAREQGEFR